MDEDELLNVSNLTDYIVQYPDEAFSQIENLYYGPRMGDFYSQYSFFGSQYDHKADIDFLKEYKELFNNLPSGLKTHFLQLFIIKNFIHETGLKEDNPYKWSLWHKSIIKAFERYISSVRELALAIERSKEEDVWHRLNDYSTSYTRRYVGSYTSNYSDSTWNPYLEIDEQPSIVW